MEDYLKKAIEIDIKDTARKHLVKAMKTWGIEKTEEKIKDLYKLSPKLKEIMLREYFFLTGLDKR